MITYITNYKIIMYLLCDLMLFNGNHRYLRGSSTTCRVEFMWLFTEKSKITFLAFFDKFWLRKSPKIINRTQEVSNVIILNKKYQISHFYWRINNLGFFTWEKCQLSDFRWVRGTSVFILLQTLSVTASILVQL